MRIRTTLPWALLLATLLPGTVEGRPIAFGRPDVGIVRIAWNRLAGASRAPAWRPDVALEAGQGRRVLEFTPGEPAAALFVEVAGTIEFERVDFALDDGTVHSVDAFGAVRGRGLYQIADLDQAHQVLWVRIVARAVSRRSELGLRLARP